MQSINVTDSAIEFTVTDHNKDIPVVYSGALPSMFQQGRDTVVVGSMTNGKFYAKKVLAKHDNYYRPKVSDDS